MKLVKNILKGAVIGVANIIPGVSGGTMAVSMGIYDKLIFCITNIFKSFKESLKFLAPLGIGMVLALVSLSFVIETALDRFPLPTNCLFIGLIVGGFPAMWKKVKGTKVKFGYILSCIAFFAIVVGFAAIGSGSGKSVDLTFSLWSVIKLFVVGVIASATMVIPGVSGSMMLMLMGYYAPIISAIKNFIEALVSFNVPVLLETMGILVPAGIGIIVGIAVIAKLIEIIFRKIPLYAYWAIIGLIVASPVAIVLLNHFPAITIGSILISIVLFAVGFVISMKLGGE